MKSFTAALIAALGTALLAGALLAPGANAAKRAQAREYVVGYKAGVSAARAKAVVRAAGGKVVQTRKALRLLLVRSSKPGFAQTLRGKRAISGVAAQRRDRHLQAGPAREARRRARRPRRRRTAAAA